MDLRETLATLREAGVVEATLSPTGLLVTVKFCPPGPPARELTPEEIKARLEGETEDLPWYARDEIAEANLTKRREAKG